MDGVFLLKGCEIMKILTFTEKQNETLKSVIEQVESSPESLGVSQSDADELYDVVFRSNHARDTQRPIDESCVSCMVLGGECCGMFYWHDDGRVLCNECGREASVKLTP